MRKSNAQRVREYRERKKARLEAAVAATRTPWEEAAVLCADLGEDRPGANAAAASDRPGKNPGSVVRTEITREWVLDQLRLFALDPPRGTPAAVAALKALLAEIPKGSAMKPEDGVGEVRNTVVVTRAASSAVIEQRAKELAVQWGVPIPEGLPAPKMIGGGQGDDHEASEEDDADP